jgi:hypothetical protein
MIGLRKEQTVKASKCLSFGIVALISAVVAVTVAWAQAPAPGRAAEQSDVERLKAELTALKSLLPDQAHAMMDVDYHFSNLWFAAKAANWPLATFYLGETHSHLNWAVRLRPVRRLSNGAELDLRAMLKGVEESGLAKVGAAIQNQDARSFEDAYRQTLTGCYACHSASEKPYLHPGVPTAPATRMIQIEPQGNSAPR